MREAQMIPAPRKYPLELYEGAVRMFRTAGVAACDPSSGSVSGRFVNLRPTRGAVGTGNRHHVGGWFDLGRALELWLSQYALVLYGVDTVGYG